MGGTGIIALGDTIGRIDHNGKGGDHMGRWSYFHFKRRNANPLTVISIYQVCSKPTDEIGATAWHQQRRALDLEQRHQVHPRTACLLSGRSNHIHSISSI
jgi:hypothetical protein